MARAPPGAKVPKKRGLLGLLEKKGSKIDPKTRLRRVEEGSKILPTARIFDQWPPRFLRFVGEPKNSSGLKTFGERIGTFSTSCLTG